MGGSMNIHKISHIIYLIPTPTKSIFYKLNIKLK